MMRVWWRKLIGKPLSMLWLSHPIFLEHEPGIHHPESPKRIGVIEAEIAKQGIDGHIWRLEAEEASDKQLALVHANRYLNFLESMRPQPGKIYRLDDDTVMSHQSLLAARYAAGAVVKAVDRVMAGKGQNAFCAIRPPGHHAESAKAGGFCLVNNVAVGAMHAIATHRLKRIAIIDFDVHHNNGTAEIFKDDPRVMLLNSCEPDLYPFPQPHHEGQNPNIINLFLQKGSGSREMRQAVREFWLPALKSFQPQLVFLSAGFDAHRDDQVSYLNWHEADYAWLTHKIIQAANSCSGKIVSVLEGGYHLPSLAKSAAAHLYVLSGMGKPPVAVAYDDYLKNHSGEKE